MWPNDVLSDPLWQRLAMALLHFLWQGTLVAAVYGLAIQWFRNGPERRYLIGVVALVVLAACPTITYWLVQPPHPSSAQSVTHAAAYVPIVSAGETEKLPAVNLVWIDDSLNTAASDGSTNSGIGLTQQYTIDAGPPTWRQELNRWVLTAWLVGVIVFAARLFAGALGLRLLSARTLTTDREYLRLVERLSRAMRLRRIPRLVASDRVRQAIATGFFRPLIIVPAAWLSELPPSVIEAVVAHELAHIRRHDLWINLIQRVAEALLFFHPAVWWISRQLRSDREMCCDELAVAATQQKLEYVSALELVARRAAREPVFSLATGIGGRKMQLLERVRHVLGLPSATRPRAWWPAGILALAVPCGLWLMSDVATPIAQAQDREESAERERDEREDRERESADRERDRARGEREEANRERDRARQERDEANRERDRERREAIRDRAVRDREGDRPARDRGPRERREGDQGDRAPRKRDLPDSIRRDREREANEEGLFRRAREQAMQARRAEEAVMHQQRQAQEAMQAARNQMQEALAQASKQLAAEIQRAQEGGQQEKLQALHQQLEQLQRQAKEQNRALDQKFEAFARRFQQKETSKPRPEEMQVRQMMEKVEHELAVRGKELAVRAAEAEKSGDKALLEKIHAEAAMFKADASAQRDKLKRALGEQLGEKVAVKVAKDPLANKLEYKYTGKQPEGSPDAQQELMRMIKELRGEVQQLRREVRELREQGGRAEKKPGGKQAVSFELDEVIEKKIVKPEVRFEFGPKSDEIKFVPRSEEEESVEPRLELEFSNEEIEKIELDAVDKAAEAKAIELDIQLNDGKLSELKGVELEFTNDELDQLKHDIDIELKDGKLTELKGVELEFTNDKLDKLNQKIDQVKKLDIDSTIELNTRIKEKNDKPHKNAVEKTLKTTIELIKGLSPVKAEIKEIELKNPTSVTDKVEVRESKVVDKVKVVDVQKQEDKKPADKQKP